MHAFAELLEGSAGGVMRRTGRPRLFTAINFNYIFTMSDTYKRPTDAVQSATCLN